MIKDEDLVGVSTWLESIEPWSEDVVDNNRFIWTNWFGVPMHVWNSKFFKLVSCTFGKLIRVDEDTLQRRKLQMARILIRTPYDELPRTPIAVSIDGKIFHVRVREEVEDMEEVFDDWSSEDVLEDDGEDASEMVKLESNQEDELSREMVSSVGKPGGGVIETSEVDPGDIPASESHMLLEQDPTSGSATNISRLSPTPLVNIPFAHVPSNAVELVDPVINILTEVVSVDPIWPDGFCLPNKIHRKSKSVSWADQSPSAQEGINLVVDLNGPVTSDVVLLELTGPSDSLSVGMLEGNDPTAIEHEQREPLLESVSFQGEAQCKFEVYHGPPDARGQSKSSKFPVGQTVYGPEIDSSNLGISEEARKAWELQHQRARKEGEEKRETKLESISDNICKSIWGHSKFDWAFKASVGRSGGILSLWNSDIFRKTSSWDSCGMLVINGFFPADGRRGVLINVYASCSYAEKKGVWDTISLVMDQYSEACICVVGDFNAIRSPEERVGRGEVDDVRDMVYFDDFIYNSNLVDMPLSGRTFTCYRPDGTCKSKLDRILVNSEWIARWTNQTLKGHSRTLSDHCPIYMASERKNWGPRPFRFINAWVKHPNFKEFLNLNGAATKLKEKLKLLRNDLKVWNKEVFGEIDKNITDKQREIDLWDRIDDTFGLEEYEVIARNKCSAELLRFTHWKENFMFQKSKTKKGNEIDGLFFDEVWTDSVEGVKNGVRNHFLEQFKSPPIPRLNMPRLLFARRLDGGRGVCNDIQKVIGNGEGTDFWRDIWAGEYALCEKFNRLYRLSTQQEARVGGMGEHSTKTRTRQLTLETLGQWMLLDEECIPTAR
ncbi:hypothetical protein ACS0TY_001731 [Phlomoides rotata]